MIRKYREADLAKVLSLWAEASALGHPFLNEDFQKSERQKLANVYLPNAETWVWDTDERIGGFISLMGNEIGGLFVDPALHGRGIGTALVNHARSLREELEVEVFKKNDPGRSFYDAYGFIEENERLHAETGLAIVRLRLSSAKPSPTEQK